MTEVATKKTNLQNQPSKNFHPQSQICAECGEQAISIGGEPVCYLGKGVSDQCTFSRQVKANMKKK
jgi:hypothetical protein